MQYDHKCIHYLSLCVSFQLPGVCDLPNVRVILILVSCEQLLHCIYLVFEALLFIGPAANANVALNPHNASRVEHRMALADDFHALIPCSFYTESEHMLQKHSEYVIAYRELFLHCAWNT